MLSKEQLENVVIPAIKQMVEEEVPGIEYSTSLVPSKKRGKGGLEMTWNGWHAALSELISALEQHGSPYDKLVLDVVLVEETFPKTLHTLRNRLIARLDLIQTHGL